MTESEKRYQNKQPLDIDWLIYPLTTTFGFAYFSYSFLMNMMEKVIPNSIVIIILVVFYLVIFRFLFKMHNGSPKLKTLIINASSIEIPFKNIIWTDSTQVYEIIDFSNSNIERLYTNKWKNLIGKSKNKAFFIVDSDQEPKSLMDMLKVKNPALLISTNNWQIDDFDELRDFFKKIEHPAQPLSAEQSIQYFPKVADLGRRSQMLAFSSIVFMIIAMVFTHFDNYRTVEYGDVKYIVMIFAITCVVSSFQWIKGNWKVWLPQITVSILVTFTLIFMMSSAMLTFSQTTKVTSEMTFRYVGEVDGAKHWVQDGDIANGLDCQTVNVEIGTLKTVKVIQPLGMMRVKEADLCRVK